MLIPRAARAPAARARTPGVAMLVPITQTTAAFFTVTFSYFPSSSRIRTAFRSLSQMTIEMLLALVAFTM